MLEPGVVKRTSMVPELNHEEIQRRKWSVEQHFLAGEMLHPGESIPNISELAQRAAAFWAAALCAICLS